MKNYLVYIVVFLILLSFGYYKLIYSKYIPEIPINQTNLIDANGIKLDLQSLKNTVYIISFFQSWCGDCRKEIPELEALQKNVGGVNNLRIILVSDEDWGKINQVKNYLNSNLEFYHSDKKLKHLGIKRYPTTYLLDKKGKVIDAKVEGIHWNNSENIALIKKIN